MNNRIMRENTLEYMNEVEEMKETRLNICKQCGLYLETPNGAVCNSRLYMSIDDKTTISEEPKIGFKRGCNCRINHLVSVPFRHCSFNKW